MKRNYCSSSPLISSPPLLFQFFVLLTSTSPMNSNPFGFPFVPISVHFVQICIPFFSFRLSFHFLIARNCRFVFSGEIKISEIVFTLSGPILLLMFFLLSVRPQFYIFSRSWLICIFQSRRHIQPKCLFVNCLCGCVPLFTQSLKLIKITRVKLI